MSAEQTSRIDWKVFENVAPGIVTALRAISKSIDDSGLEKSVTELLKLRASQLNGCAFCLQFHLNSARALRMPPAKLDLVATWRDVDIFSARERAALAWTEALTLMAQQPIADTAYAQVRAHFSDTETVFLTASIGAINAWNRIAGSLRFTPPIPAN